VTAAAVPCDRGSDRLPRDGSRQGLLHRQDSLHQPRPTRSGQGHGRAHQTEVHGLLLRAPRTSKLPCMRPTSSRAAPSVA
jgi:hypothetical protein